MKTVVAIERTGQFQAAAVELSVTQQAVSKRVATLERELGVRLFTRTARGARLTIDGQAFLPHARELAAAAERARASVRPERRALRVDVLGRRSGPGGLMREFHRTHPDVELDVVAIVDGREALAAVQDGTLDATFRAVLSPLPAGLTSRRVLDAPHQLLTGPAHPLADAPDVRTADLKGLRIWMPGIVPGSEWGAYYDAFTAQFGVTIDAIGPNFGPEALLDAIADSAELTTLVDPHTRLVWPAEHDLRRIPLRDPVPVYPHALIWRRGNRHPGLARLRDALPHPDERAGTWVPPAAR